MIQKKQIDLSGMNGLCPMFFGDKPYSNTSPNLRYLGSDGQLADGIYNPLSTIGYMSPSNNIFTSLTGTISNPIISNIYSPSNDIAYFFENGTKFSYISTLGDTSLDEVTLLSESSTFKDSELYEINDNEAIFYTYLENNPTISNVKKLQLGYMSTDRSKGAIQLASKIYETLDISDTSYLLIASGSSQKLAQSFSTTNFYTGNDSKVSGIRLRLNMPYVGTTQNWTIKVGIQSDSFGNPSGSYVTNAYATLSASQLPVGDYDYVYFEFQNIVTLTASTIYHIVVEPTVWGDIGSNEGVRWMSSTNNNSLLSNGKYEYYNGSSWTKSSLESFDFALILNNYNYIGYNKRVDFYETPTIDSTGILRYRKETTKVATSVSYTASSTGVSINMPTGTTYNDIMFALTSNTAGYCTGVPDGWTKIAGATFNGKYYELFYKVALNGETGSYTFSGGSGSYRGVIITYRGGFDVSNPIETYSNTNYNTSNNQIIASSITTSNINTNLLFFGTVEDSNSRIFTEPTNFTEDYDDGDSSSDFYNIIAHRYWTSSGATGNISAKISANETDKHAFAVALRPLENNSTTSYKHTTISSDNVCLVVGVHRTDSSSLPTVTCDGVTMSQLHPSSRGSGGTGYVSLFYITGVSSGTHTISLSGSYNVMSVAYTGIDQINTITGNGTNTGGESVDINYTISLLKQVPILIAINDSSEPYGIYAGSNTTKTNNYYELVNVSMFGKSSTIYGTSLGTTTLNVSDGSDSSSTTYYVYGLLNPMLKSSTYSNYPTIEVQDTSSILHSSNNGLLYWMTGNKVHSFDGYATGGDFGIFRENLLSFPNFIKIVDVAEANSLSYIAIEISDTSNPDYRMFSSDLCGVYAWDYKSTVEGIRNYYTCPGARSIKKVFVNGDGEINLITIGNNRLTEIRHLVNGKFIVKYRLGLNAYPNNRDSFGYLDNLSIWYGNDGIIYGLGRVLSGQQEGIFKLGDSSSSMTGAFTSGTLICGNLASGTAGSNIDKILLSCNDTTGNKIKEWYPSGTGTINTVSQLGNIGNIYTLVNYLPDMSIVKYIDIRCAPTGTGSDVIATIKYYFNGLSTPSITKSITKQEASRGYIRHEINKPYVNAIQIEIEYSTLNVLGSTNDFKPSTAIIVYEDTQTKG